MLISVAIPCYNRTDDLRKTIPYTIEAANISPPIEIAILDYNSPDDLYEFSENLINTSKLTNGNSIIYNKYSGKNYFDKAHAFNLAILATHGEYFCLFGTDAYPELEYFKYVRKLIDDNCIWMRANKLRGIITCQRKEFIDAGGYDERFELYGPEDKDLDERLYRRGSKFGLIPSGLLHVIHTSDDEKVKNFRIKADKHVMSNMMRVYYEENKRIKALTVNHKGWGKWI